MTEQENWIELEKQYFLPVSKRLPITLTRGEGTRVWDLDDREYLDFVAGIAAVSLGHCHPEIVKAIERQSMELMHTSNYYYTIPQVKLAKLLCDSAGLDKVFFCNSGAEAVEGCIKIARKWGKDNRDGAYEIIVAEDAFHGRTMATVTAAGNEKYRAPFGPLLEGFVRVPFNDIEAIKNATTGKTCAVLLEPIQGEGGVNIPDDDYLKQVRAWCDEQNILLILDEVQTGIARTGTMFAYEQYGVEPDIMALAKGLAGGVPIGAILAKEEIALMFVPGDHGSTFSGNPLATAAGYAVLKHIVDTNLAAQVKEKGERLIAKLHSLEDRHGTITEVRGRGLLCAVQFDADIAEQLVREALTEGLLLNNLRPNVLRIAPPLTVSDEEIDAAVDKLDRV